jgi:PHD/YefM family antitoxin component YafN of YafNO toxin-antitoxin module
MRVESMVINTISSRKFNLCVSDAKKLSQTGPLLITEDGRPSHVLLMYENYQRLSRVKENVVELLTFPGAENIDLPIPTMKDFPVSANFFS